VPSKVRKPDSEWKEILTTEQYRITRKRGTEVAFTGEHWETKDAGTYHCVCCGSPLFSSEEKFESGCGWPSFTAPLGEDSVREELDTSLFMRRTEVLCESCDAHLGHMFPDGPQPTGIRYCINSGALRLESDASPGDEG
jgi:peptide-methionine (R)-S-oxide reductase